MEAMVRKGLLRPHQAAKRLGVTTASLRRWTLEGKITAAWHTPGGEARYDPDSIEAMLKRCEPARDFQQHSPPRDLSKRRVPPRPASDLPDFLRPPAATPEIPTLLEMLR